MNILLSPAGSAGDVHPFVGLGLELQRGGHQVTLIVCEYFEDLVRRVGLDYVELGTAKDFLAMTNHPALWDPVKSFPHIFHEAIKPLMREQYRILEERSDANTVVVGSVLGFGARIAREKLRLPLVSVHLQPSILWSEFESPVLPKTFISHSIAPRWAKRLQYWLGETLVIDRATLPATNAFRAELGLPPMRKTTRWWHSPDQVVCLFPDWFAPVQPDWPANVVTTHFPLWDERGVNDTPPEVASYLAEGEPPVVFTPGSAMRFGEAFFATAAETCRRLNRRGMLLSRFPEHIPADLPAGVKHFTYVPFSELLPQAAALVHHGGIGTMAQAMAAGIPQLIMPLAHDQPDNAARIQRLGIGDALFPKAFKPPALSAKLETLLNSTSVKQSCASVAQKFAGRSGLAEAAVAIEKFGEQATG